MAEYRAEKIPFYGIVPKLSARICSGGMNINIVPRCCQICTGQCVSCVDIFVSPLYNGIVTGYIIWCALAFEAGMNNNNDCNADDLRRGKIALVGELAVPCSLQSATAGMNPGPRTSDVSSALDKQ